MNDSSMVDVGDSCKAESVPELPTTAHARDGSVQTATSTHRESRAMGESWITKLVGHVTPSRPLVGGGWNGSPVCLRVRFPGWGSQVRSADQPGSGQGALPYETGRERASSLTLPRPATSRDKPC